MFHCNVLLADSTLYLSLFDSCLFILIECHKIKSKATTTANQKRENYRQKSQWELKIKISQPSKARENAGDQVVIGVSFESDWLRVARIFSTNHRATKCNLGLLPTLTHSLTVTPRWTIDTYFITFLHLIKNDLQRSLALLPFTRLGFEKRKPEKSWFATY